MDVSSPANWNSGGSVMNAFIPSVRLMPFRVPPCRRCPRRRTLSRLSLVSPVSSVHFYSVLSSIAHLHLLSLRLFFPPICLLWFPYSSIFATLIHFTWIATFFMHLNLRLLPSFFSWISWALFNLKCNIRRLICLVCLDCGSRQGENISPPNWALNFTNSGYIFCPTCHFEACVWESVCVRLCVCAAIRLSHPPLSVSACSLSDWPQRTGIIWFQLHRRCCSVGKAH